MGHTSHVQGAQIKLLGMQETRGEIGLAEGRRGLRSVPFGSRIILFTSQRVSDGSMMHACV